MQLNKKLVNELVEDYTQSRYEKEYLKEKINEILNRTLPEINSIIKNKEKETESLWNLARENKEIEDLFRKIIEKIDMPIVIYVASKFKNNKYFGNKIIKESLKPGDF